MSGGPTIDEKGNVVGVNVSSAGNQLSFLVPADRVASLMKTVTLPSGRRDEPSMALLGRQLKASQEIYLKGMFDSSAKTIEFGPYRVPTEPAPFFRCWGDRQNDRDRLYDRSVHTCETDDNIFLGDEQTTGTVLLSHELFSTQTLTASQFFRLYESRFEHDTSPTGESEYVTNWKCQNRNIQNGNMKLRVAQCLRRYRELGELYDSYTKVAALGRSNVGLVSTFAMTGVTFENASQISKRFVEQITWR
jgi:hypothetical protein